MFAMFALDIQAGWIWAGLAIIFLLIEVLTVSFFFLLWAIAAAGVALLTFICALSWQWQLFYFALFSLPLLPLWARLASHWQSDPSDAAAILNQRSAQYIGREFELQTPVTHGVGKLQIGDTLWTIKGDNAPAGARIVITAAEDNYLHFRHVY